MPRALPIRATSSCRCGSDGRRARDDSQAPELAGPATAGRHRVSREPLARRFSPSPVALSCGARRAPWVGRADPSDTPCLPADGAASRVRRRVLGRAVGLREDHVKVRAGGVAEGWRASRCDRRLTAEPRPAPVLSHAYLLDAAGRLAGDWRGRCSGARARCPAWSLWPVPRGTTAARGACAPASAAPRQRRRQVMVAQEPRKRAHAQSLGAFHVERLATVSATGDAATA